MNWFVEFVASIEAEIIRGRRASINVVPPHVEDQMIAAQAEAQPLFDRTVGAPERWDITEHGVTSDRFKAFVAACVTQKNLARCSHHPMIRPYFVDMVARTMVCDDCVPSVGFGSSTVTGCSFCFVPIGKEATRIAVSMGPLHVEGVACSECVKVCGGLVL